LLQIFTKSKKINMKRIFLLPAMMVLANVLLAQNVGIGTQTPHASAQLDVSSTTRGLLAPRMTTTQRNAIASPAKGLLVYDTDLNSLFHYNGSSWANFSGSGNFSLPFAAAVNLNSPNFQLENSGSGDVLFLGASTGSAINAYNTGNAAAISVSATNGFGVYAQSFNSIPVFALSTNAANTLPAIRANNTGGGVGLHATSAKNDGIVSTTSATNKVAVKGEATGSGSDGILGTSVNGYGVHGITNSGFYGVFGEHKGTSGSGVRGVAHSSDGVGISGESNNGIGVNGYSNSGVGVEAKSPSGTALRSNSTNGYALETSGKVKIAGGNTNPSAGAVLTSVDASGNAVWANPPKVAFKVFGVPGAHREVPDEAARRIQYQSEAFDRQNNFELLANNATPTANSSTFTAPITGVYHFDVISTLTQSGIIQDMENAWLILYRNRNGNETELARVYGNRTFRELGGSEEPDYASFNISVTESLLAGDKIYVVVYHTTGTHAFIGNGTENVFSGHLVFAD
jgi:hypothetical protein